MRRSREIAADLSLWGRPNYLALPSHLLLARTSLISSESHFPPYLRSVVCSHFPDALPLLSSRDSTAHRRQYHWAHRSHGWKAPHLHPLCAVVMHDLSLPCPCLLRVDPATNVFRLRSPFPQVCLNLECSLPRLVVSLQPCFPPSARLQQLRLCAEPACCVSLRVVCKTPLVALFARNDRLELTVPDTVCVRPPTLPARLLVGLVTVPHFLPDLVTRMGWRSANPPHRGAVRLVSRMVVAINWVRCNLFAT